MLPPTPTVYQAAALSPVLTEHVLGDSHGPALLTAVKVPFKTARVSCLSPDLPFLP